MRRWQPPRTGPTGRWSARAAVREAKLQREVAFRTFNMGIGFCAISPVGQLEKALAAMPGSIAIGEIVAHEVDAPRVVLA